MTVRPRALGAVALVLGAAVCGQAGAAEPEEIIKYRQATMKALGGHMTALAQIVRGKVGFSEHLQRHAEAIAALEQDLKALFPEGSDFGETGALPEVWKKPAEFEKAASEASKAAEALVAAAKGASPGAIGPAFEGVGKTCKGCHDTFRKED